MGPLHGVRIIDMTSVLMGPFATQALGDMGADVVKVEAPAGDVIREVGPARHEGMGPMFLNVNRSKRSLVLDLKLAAAREVLLRLVRGADVLVYNVRPAAMERLGLGYATLAALNPRLVYAGLVGYDQAGPYAARPAYDDLIQGGSTLAQLMARSGDGTPRYVPTALADRVVGATAVGAILAALFERERSGRGQRVDVPMFETMVAFVLSDHLGGLTFHPPLDAGGYARQLSPERRPYATRDGYVCALVYTDAQWQRFLLAVGRDELLADARFASFAERSRHIDEVYGELARIFATRGTAEWLALLDAADVPAMPMHDLQSVLDDPQLEASHFFAMVEHPSEGRVRSMRPPPVYSRTPAEPLRLAPRHGEHSREVLREAGYDEAEIDALVAAGAVQQAADAPATGEPGGGTPSAHEPAAHPAAPGSNEPA
jgi:crotonobetainyl-CoA:carnitine CoA-transferase CaiB-like acyl-CoA transferase